MSADRHGSTKPSAHRGARRGARLGALRPLVFVLLALLARPAEAGPRPREIDTDRRLSVLPSPRTPEDRRRSLLVAGRKLGRLPIDLAGERIDGPRLVRLATATPDGPVLRQVREGLGLPVDLDDLLLLLDDVIRARRRLGRRPVSLPAGRARAVGVLVHPDDVFRDRPREYGATPGKLLVDPPAEQPALEPAPDGAPLGPRWTRRHPQPETEAERMAALIAANPDFAARVAALTGQLRAQGAKVYVESTLRPRARGYLIWGSYLLSKARSGRDLERKRRLLERLNGEWGLEVAIRWRAPGPWWRTRRAARDMAEAFAVDYATRRGAERSDHYDGAALDLWVIALPRALELVAPDGTRARFDLSGEAHPRDLSLEPELIEWIEAHFAFEKLRQDHPHWRDAKMPRDRPRPTDDPGPAQ